MTDYPKFAPIPRLHRELVITEKVDGTNGLISIEEATGDTYGIGAYETTPDGTGIVLNMAEDDLFEWKPVVVRAGSRNRWLAPTKEKDNFGFAAWVRGNAYPLAKHLGTGMHYGEWYGQGIQSGYGLEEKRFALFNTHRWTEDYLFETGLLALGVDVVPVLLQNSPGTQINADVNYVLERLRNWGSLIAPGFMRPEGIVVYHTAAKQYFKVTLENDEKPKSQVSA